MYCGPIAQRNSMNTSTFRGRALPAAALLLALVAVVAVVASGALGRAGDPGKPYPSAPPSNPPTSTPKPTPTPSGAPANGIFDVDLKTVDDTDVTIVVDDATGTVVKASSGDPGDGMSVRWFDMKVENVDAKTLRLTWVGLPVDAQARLLVSRDDGKLRLRFFQPAPPINSDALGHDRILVLMFDEPVSADDVVYSFQESRG
jgi:hypothetical protein